MKKNQLRKLAMALVVIMFGFQAFAQGRIDLAPNGTKTQGAQHVTMSGFDATFSYNSIESELVSTERGDFSVITMGNSVPAGNIGDPQVLVHRELIAVPFGATPVVTVKNYTVNEYKLADFGIEKLYPMQPSQSKSETEVEFAYNEAAYAAKGYDERPIAEVFVLGTMRGVQVGALQLNTVRYNAATNTIRVYNDIDVEVTFEDADLALTEQTLVNTYSPYFRTVYSALFNERAILDIYDEHPDLWAVPVKMLVVANRMFEDAMQPWITWKTEKGFVMDVNYTDEIGTTASAIKTFITDKYNEGVANGQAPTFIIIIGDQNQVPQSQMGSATHKVTDLYYYAVAGNDVFGDMFHSRFTCETVQEFQNVLDKSMMYEQYTMQDPSYLSNVLLIAGWDGSWNPRIGKPTIQYATNYYYNAAHGFVQVNQFLEQPYNNPYASMNTGVNFVNYTAHGGDTNWSDPSFSVSDVNSLTNNGKYFLAMGNCCLAANWGYSSKSFGEAMIIAQNKGAYAYIGSPVETYWYEDYYFGVGATNTMNQMPTYEGSTMGTYDAQFRDDWNCITAVPYVGNLAVAYAHANGYQSSSTATDQYYWEAYHVLGDGSVCPYHVNPTENEVSHMPTFPIGMDFYTVSADPGSYVGISKDGVLYGAAEIGEEGTADIPVTPITSGGEVKIVVTHPQRQPYVATVPAAAMTGPYIAVDSYTPGNVPCNEEQNMSITFKNVGADATTATTNVVLTCESEDLTIIDGEGSFEALEADGTVTLNNEFSFIVASGVADGTKIQIDVTATCGADVWAGKAKVTVGAPIIEFSEMQWAGSFEPGETVPVVVNFSNVGHYQATNAEVAISSTSSYVTFDAESYEIGAIAPQGEGIAVFNVIIDASCPSTDVIPLTFTLTADNEVTATGEGVLKNTCNVKFDLVDSYGDGWNGNKLRVSFNDGTPAQELTIESGGSSATYVIEIGVNVHVTLGWITGSYISECSFTVSYEGGDVITSASNLSSSYNFEFDVNCNVDPSIYAPVRNLEAAVEGNVVTLTWDAPETGEPVSYIIKRDGAEITSVTGYEYIDENLAWETTYTYTITAEYVDGYSIPVVVKVTVGVDNIGENEVSFGVYPNPASDMLNVVTDAENYEYQLINSIGQVVINGKANGNKSINVSELNGVYFLRIIADGNTIVRKVTVK